MLAGPDVTAFTMRRAIAFTLAALQSAHEIDPSISAKAQKVLAAEAKALEGHAKALRDAERALEDYDLGDGTLHQARVVLGDSVLDDGVRRANAKTKIALKDAGGSLDASHVFGNNVTDLTNEKLALEPQRVLEAAQRFDDLASFSEKAALVKDLTARANKQQGFLDDRASGDKKRAKLASALVRAIADAAEALAMTKATLDHEFPRQRTYVAGFFLDVGHRRDAKSGGEAPKPGAGAGDGAPTGAAATSATSK